MQRKNRNWRFRWWIWIHICKVCTERTLYTKQIEETNSWRPTHALTKLYDVITLNNPNWRVNYVNVNSVCSWSCNNRLGSSFPPVTENIYIFAAPFVTWRGQYHWPLYLKSKFSHWRLSFSLWVFSCLFLSSHSFIVCVFRLLCCEARVSL